ncbi:MAG: hypothetical protein JWN04_2610 [Myxococcaceae bacterium]|nr:hypothetical protein [Myxococcaceae bacterium]
MMLTFLSFAERSAMRPSALTRPFRVVPVTHPRPRASLRARRFFLLAALGLAACADSTEENDGRVGAAAADASSVGAALDATTPLMPDALCPPLDQGCVTMPASYKSVIEPLVESRCGGCHKHGVGDPWPLNTRRSLDSWAEAVQLTLQNCSMPPADAGTSITVQERLELWTWLSCGAPDN